jgi:hypothetical protein
MWVWVFFDYNMFGLLIKSRDMFGEGHFGTLYVAQQAHMLVREQVCYGE